MPALYGLYYFFQNQQFSLPLLNVRAEASIKELAAQVKLTQTYGNDATFPIQAKFSFPIPARAVVAAFCMIKQDGTRIVGSVMEKQEAKETYDTAVSQGQQASLMEQQTPDVFQVSVGNIPFKEQVQIELVYATELTEDEENDQIRFHLPVHIGPRYGRPPGPSFTDTAFISPSSPAPFLSLLVNVEAVAPISKIGCPSHSVSTELGPDSSLPNFKDLPFSNYARVSLASESALDQDFVLTIKSAGLDTPRCVAELHPSNDTVAMGLTLVPRFRLPDLSRQEFVFLVDRSGSMQGKRIEAARKALVVMLRSLPHQDSLFQIASFGTRHSFLWEAGSKVYNQETLDEATRHVDTMQSNYGGTNIRNALAMCFKARKLDRPMSLLVLTDGDAWDIDGVLEEVKAAVASAPANAYLRVSVLGIGNSASTAMCEGIARVGNGTCMMVCEEETSFTGKIARMLKAARTPISNVSVDWGRPVAEEEFVAAESDEESEDDFEMVDDPSEKPKKTLSIFDESVDDLNDFGSTAAPPPAPVVLPHPAVVQQAPFKIQHLFPNIRLNVYAILQGQNVPKTVTIRGSTADGSEIALPITVTLSSLPNAPNAPPAVHALAARKIIQDLEDGRHDLASVITNPDDADLLKRTVKASIIRLGKTYSIASSHTSFVAVDEFGPVVQEEVYVLSGVAAPTSPWRTLTKGSRSMRTSRAAAPAQGDMSASMGSMPVTILPTQPSMPPPLFGQAAPFPPSSSELGVQSFGMSPAAFPVSSASRPLPRPSRESAVATSLFSARPSITENTTALDPLEALARLQAFDGAFSLDVLTIVKLSVDIQVVRNAFPAGSGDAIVATVLAMAYLSARLGLSVNRDSWEGIYDKAKEYVEAALGAEMDALEAKVVTMLV
ncbi:von Willebrand factor type A domain-containing protein [Roridomyces roridus]|uniref:von Willebrand factor type A domain-containing protein n=1 Tax=Roridomyces roridus TaxID=1738132 RepID=A0AAD7FEP0_9AGAR|nr:von Willebrand factor type A domain-containing protein [Roridomyces roridus]